MAAIFETARFSTGSAGAVTTFEPPAHLGSASAPPPFTVQLGLSRRAVMVAATAMVVAMLLAASASVVLGRQAASTPAPSPAPVAVASGPGAGPVVAVVAPGDTVWSIARQIQPRGDIRPLVDQLVAINGSATIVPGQELRLPAS